MKRFFFIGILSLPLALAIAVLVFLGIARMGFVPVNADQSPSSLERKLFSMAVRASVKRHAAAQADSSPVAEEEMRGGMEIYKAMCAQCHGQLNGRESILGASFYPPAPQLLSHPAQYNREELVWIIKHGIRNTSMPAWKNLLSDQDIDRVAAFVKSLGTDSTAVQSRSGEAGGDIRESKNHPE